MDECVCGYCGVLPPNHTEACRELQAATGMLPRQMTEQERNAMQLAYWGSISILDEGFTDSASTESK